MGQTSLIETLPLDLVLWGLVIFVFLGFVAYSAIMMWHWRMYSTGRFTTVSTMIVYLTVCGGLFAIMIASAVWYMLA